MRFTDRLAARSAHSLLTVGLDPDPARFPHEWRGDGRRIFDFCRGIVDATAVHANGFKPQIAYFAAHRAEDQLEALCDYIRTHYPEHPIVLDAKRGDIGSTAEQYAREAFERYQAHAVTLSPYMGTDSIEPWLRWSDRGLFLLCRTSNPGGSDLQFLSVTSQHTDRDPAHSTDTLFEHVARLAAERWNPHGQTGLVVGATFPSELARVRAIVGPDMPLLVPGVGAQGGDAHATVRAGAGSNRAGLMINSSRAILYASGGADWQEGASREARATREALEQARRTL